MAPTTPSSVTTTTRPRRSKTVERPRTLFDEVAELKRDVGEVRGLVDQLAERVGQLNPRRERFEKPGQAGAQGPIPAE